MRGGDPNRGLKLLPWMHPVCKCSHKFVQHLSGDEMNHYAQCRVGHCQCDNFKSLNNLEYLEYLNDYKKEYNKCCHSFFQRLTTWLTFGN